MYHGSLGIIHGKVVLQKLLMIYRLRVSIYYIYIYIVIYIFNFEDHLDDLKETPS